MKKSLLSVILLFIAWAVSAAAIWHSSTTGSGDGSVETLFLNLLKF